LPYDRGVTIGLFICNGGRYVDEGRLLVGARLLGCVLSGRLFGAYEATSIFASRRFHLANTHSTAGSSSSSRMTAAATADSKIRLMATDALPSHCRRFRN